MTTTPGVHQAEQEQLLREVLAVHFDPDGGSAYWIRKACGLGFDPRDEVRTVGDLSRLGLMDWEALRSRPLEDFIPKSILQQRGHLVVVQTAGTAAAPVWTAYTQEEFTEAFVTPFCRAARHVGFPLGQPWLYVGPSGPHAIGRAAQAIAHATAAPAVFSVDFDSRWAKKLPSGSFAAGRYLDHIVEQALEILRVQDVAVLFTTPAVLDRLSSAMTQAEKERILGVHYGGMAVEPEALRRFQTEVFPNAMHLSGYGNTLFGCCLELGVAPGRELAYFPYGHRIVFKTIALEAPAEQPEFFRRAGESGRLVFSRLDRTMLLVNVVERDRVRLVSPPEGAPEGFCHLGLQSPGPAPEEQERLRVALY